MYLLIIIGFIAVSLFIIVKLTERTSKESSLAQASSVSRWIMPLILVLIITQLIYLMIQS